MRKTKKQESSTKSEVQEQVYNIWGWNSIEDVAQEVWSGLHSDLLVGNFVFAFKNPTGDIKQFVITQRTSEDYMLGVISAGYTMYLPHTTRDYLRETFIQDLKKNKIESAVIDNLLKTLT